MSKSLTCQSLLFIFLTESDSNGLLLYYLLQVFKKSNVPHISSNLVKNIVIFNNLIISELICPNYLGEIRSHQESGRLTKSPKISPRVRPSHQESTRLTKCDAMLVRFNLTKSLTNMGVPQQTVYQELSKELKKSEGNNIEELIHLELKIPNCLTNEYGEYYF